MRFLLLALCVLLIAGKRAGLMIMLAHGYTSTLMFYVIGEFYHARSRRMLYFFNRFYGSSVLFCVIFFLVFLSNRGVPPTLSFLSEFMIIVTTLVLSKMFLLIIFIYFLVSFYYSVYLIVCSFIGKLFLNLIRNNLGYAIPLVLIMFNIF